MQKSSWLNDTKKYREKWPCAAATVVVHGKLRRRRRQQKHQQQVAIATPARKIPEWQRPERHGRDDDENRHSGQRASFSQDSPQVSCAKKCRDWAPEVSLSVFQSPSQVSQSSGLSLTSVSPRWSKFRLEAKPEMGKNSLKEGRE